MINFTVGPVTMDESIMSIGAEQMPYFRTEEFSKLIIENEQMIIECLHAEKDSKVLFLTCSGTGAMEATIMNILSKDDKVLIINGGSFGQRFKDICELHKIQNLEMKLKFGEIITEEHLNRYKNVGLTTLVINIHETSTGVLYDMDLIGDFCKKENMFLVVDAISSFLADKIDMNENKIDVLIASSQKALALPPGMSFVALNKAAQKKIDNIEVRNMYFDFKYYIKDGKRGQTPFTPAVSILMQLNKRLTEIKQIGIDEVINKTKVLAEDFRSKISDLPLEIASKSLSNAMTPLRVKGKMTAYEIFEILKNEYNIYVCPNGGELKDILFRVGHMGALTTMDNDKLIKALLSMKNRKLL